MPHRAAVKKASQKGKRPSLEVIEELLGFAGPGAIKRIIGTPRIAITSSSRSGSLDKLPVVRPLKENLKVLDKSLERLRKTANQDQPFDPFAEGIVKRRVPGQRPPNEELEALALRKQQAQKIAKSDKATRKEGFKIRTKMFEDELSGTSLGKPKSPARLASELIKNNFEELVSGNISEKLRKQIEVVRKASANLKAIEKRDVAAFIKRNPQFKNVSEEELQRAFFDPKFRKPVKPKPPRGPKK